MYLKDGNVNVEVNLYKEVSKISIASSINALDLFGDNPELIPLSEQVDII